MDLENKKYLSFAHLATDTAGKVLIQFYKSKNEKRIKIEVLKKN